MGVQVQDPPLSVREKGDRVIIVLNVANVRQASLVAEFQPDEDADAPGSLHIAFTASTPTRHFEKTLVLPHAVDGSVTKDVGGKNVTLQLVKEDEGIEWGSNWFRAAKKKKAKQKRVAEATAEAASTTDGAGGASTRDVDVDAASPPDLPPPCKEALGEPEVVPAVVVEPAPEVPLAETVDGSLPSPGSSTKEGAPQRAEPKLSVPHGNSPKGAAESDLEVADGGAQVPSGGGKHKRRGKTKKGGVVQEATAVSEARGSSPSLASRPQVDPTQLQKDGALPVSPPTNPEILRLMQEGVALFPTDKKKACVLLRLAARKGYVPAHMMLADLARDNDDALLIESLCAILQEADAPKQLLPELLNQCAMQLAAVLRLPRHADERERRGEELAKLACTWPILHAAQPEAEPAKPAPSGGAPGAARQRPAAGAASQTSTEARAASGVSGGARGLWSEQGSCWVFIAELPQLDSLAQCYLGISREAVLLRGPVGDVLLRERLPATADAALAGAQWSTSLRRLTIRAPRAGGAFGRAPRAAINDVD